MVAAGCARGKRWPVWAVWHRTGALRCTVTPVGKPLAALDAVEVLLKVAEGPGKLGIHAVCLWLEVTFGLECFSSFVPFPSWWTPTFVCLQTTFCVSCVCSS